MSELVYVIVALGVRAILCWRLPLLSLGMGRAEPMGNKAAVDEVVAKFPKLQKILTTFGSSEGMVKWLEVRGKQNF